jgi:hypothetical protein
MPGGCIRYLRIHKWVFCRLAKADKSDAICWRKAPRRQNGDSPEIAFLKFVRKHDIVTLNVAGPRASKKQGVAALVRRGLEAAFFPESS